MPVSNAAPRAATDSPRGQFVAMLRGTLATLRHRRISFNRLALGLLAFALVLRVALAAVGWPATDSDEATMGIEALHIAGRGEHPVFFYGQRYMGVLEAYLAAGAFRLFGSSLFALRLGTLLLAVAGLGAIYLLVRRLYSPGIALFALALLAVGPAEPLLRELWSGGGYAETLCFGALVMLLGAWLVGTAATTPLRRRPWDIPRLAAFAGWGLAAGLGLWSDTLVAPFVLTSGLLIAVFCWREWRAAIPCAVAGLLLGAFPLIAYAVGSPDHNPFAGALAVGQSSDAWRGGVGALLAGQLTGTLLVALPTITGGSAICALPAGQTWPLAAADPHALFCTTVHGLWGAGYVALLVAAIISSVRTLRRSWTSGGARFILASESAPEAARLALASAAALTLLLFLVSPVAARAPQAVSRYLLGLLIALPVVLAPLWRIAAARAPSVAAAIAASPASRRTWAGRLALCVVALAYLIGFLGVVQAVPAAHAEGQRRAALVAHLEQSGTTRVYSEYWTCGWLIFQSRERVVCAALDHQLQPDLDRYPPYRDMVRAAPSPVYVFPIGSEQAAAYAARLNDKPTGIVDAREVYEGYVIYRPPLG
jgi:hypothetical protein